MNVIFQQTYRPPQKQIQKKQKLSIKKFVYITVFLLLIAGACAAYYEYRKIQNTPKDYSKLTSQIDSILANNSDIRVGISLVTMPKNFQKNYGDNTPFVAASTTKVLVGCYFLHEVEQGKHSLNDPMGINKSGWQLQQMINQSNDDSWSLFNNLLGGNNIQNYAKSIGLNSFVFSSNLISPSDEAVLLQKLYENKLLNPSNTKMLLSYMQNTNDESLIPNALPDDANVYHKYGELLDNDVENNKNLVHDAAIITYKKRSFVLTIYSSRESSLNLESRQLLIKQITQAVIDYETT